MPAYDYRCAKCSEDFEVFQPFSEEPLKKHPGCGGKVTKVMSAAGIVLKGSGFYKTDSGDSARSKSKKRSESMSSSSTSETKNETKSESKSETKSETKNETKSETKNDAKTETKSETKSDKKSESKTSSAA